MNSRPLYMGKALGGHAIHWERIKDVASVTINILLLWSIMAMCIFGSVFID